jgi:hypothetical protein
MYAGWFCDVGQFLRLVKELLYRICGYVAVLPRTVEQPTYRTVFSPVFPQKLKSCPGQDGIAVLTSLAITYPYRHPLAINIGYLQTGCFACPQPGRIK